MAASSSLPIGIAKFIGKEQGVQKARKAQQGNWPYSGVHHS